MTTTASPSAQPSIPQKATQNPVKGRSLYVGNLPYSVTWQSLKDMMRQAGNVIRANVMMDYQNRSKGYGTVLFATVEDAQKAIEMYNNYELNGRKLDVREDRSFAPVVDAPSENQQNENNEGETSSSGSRALWIGNIPFTFTWQDLKDHIRTAGVNPIRADISQDWRNGRSRGHGTALFSNSEEAKKAIDALNGTEVQGRVISVREDRGFVEGAPYQPFERELMMRRRIMNFHPRRFNIPNHANFAGRQLYVGNLPFSIAWQDLKDLFRSAGNVIRADVAVVDGRSKGYGTVVFATREDALNAIQVYNNYEFFGRQIVVREDKFAAPAQQFHFAQNF